LPPAVKTTAAVLSAIRRRFANTIKENYWIMETGAAELEDMFHFVAIRVFGD